LSKLFTISDVLIKPKFSYINSRKDVDISSKLGKFNLKLPVLSANMDSVTGLDMAIAMAKAGGMGILHRFWSIQDNEVAYNKVREAGFNCGVSFGLGEVELERAKTLYKAGCRLMVLDVAHSASAAVAAQYDRLKSIINYWDSTVVVGNFATSETIEDFVKVLGYKPDVVKVGIGPGSACTTRLKTGIGVPQLSAIIDCVKTGIPVIADGGLKTAGDIAKALGAGAKAVMLGGMLAGTEESPGKAQYGPKNIGNGIIDYSQLVPTSKTYRGSASKESYEAQGKTQDYITAEGESFTVPYKGEVINILKDIEGGLRSSFTYVGASTLQDYASKVEFIEISNNSFIEGTPHGKT